MERWCETNAIGSLHGRCRVHRAEILRLRGSCDEAESQALVACDELRPYLRRELGWPLNELGRIRLHKADVAGAEEAFLAAHRAGWDPQPGLALVQSGARRRGRRGCLRTRRPRSPLAGALEGAPTEHRPAARAAARGAGRDRDRSRRHRSGPHRPPMSWRSSPPDSRARRSWPAPPSLAEGCGSPMAMRPAPNRPCPKRCDSGTRSAPRTRRRIARLDLAEAHRANGSEHRAVLESQAARTILDGIAGRADGDPRRDAFARRHRDEQPIASTNVFRREGDYWSVSFDGHTVHVRDLKGMRYLARLLADPGREYHVLDLVASESASGAQPDRSDQLPRAALGTRRRGRDPRHASQGRLPPTPRRDRRRPRASARHRRRRAGRASRRRARLPRPRALACRRPRWSRSASRIRVRARPRRGDPRRPPGDHSDQRAPSRARRAPQPNDPHGYRIAPTSPILAPQPIGDSERFG